MHVMYNSVYEVMNMNDTLRILSGLAWGLQQLQEREDPSRKQQAAAHDRLWEEFRKTHRQNAALLSQVDELLFSQGLLEESRAGIQFLLGLQIGLELGSLDMLKNGLETEICFRPGP